MQKNLTYDMTAGSPMKLLTAFSLPMLIGNLFQQFYNLVDLMIVGKFVDSNALGAVGATGSLNFLFVSLSFGLGAGVGIIVSQYFGAKDAENVRRTIANSIYVLFLGAAVMSVIGFFFARTVLVFLNTPPEILDDAVRYLKVTSLGITAVAAYNGVSAMLRALGDSKTPLYFLVFSSVVNIGLDLLFVIVFKWGVFGVALGTIISQVLAAAGCILYAYAKTEYFKIPRSYFKPNGAIIKKTFKIGIPVAFQNSLIAISCIALQSVVNGFGKEVVSAYAAANRFEQLVQQPFNSLGIATSTYSGQNMGANKIDRVKRGYLSGVLIVLGYSLIMLPVNRFGGSFIMSLFVNEQSVIEIGAHLLRITSCFYFALGMIYVTRGLLNGAGDTTYSMINGMVEVSGRVGLAKPLTLIPALGVWGLGFTNGLTWLITAVISVIRYFTGKWKTKAIIDRTLY